MSDLKNIESINLKPASDELKLVVVGDGYIGKTCMLWSFVYKKFPAGYVPTVFDIHSSKSYFILLKFEICIIHEISVVLTSYVL